jgi:hypothetical protein
MAKKKDYKSILSTAFVDSNEKTTEEEALKLVSDAEFVIRQLNKDKDEDEKLEEARSIVKDLGAGYSSAVKYEKAKIDFFLDKIEYIRAVKALKKE